MIQEIYPAHGLRVRLEADDLVIAVHRMAFCNECGNEDVPFYEARIGMSSSKPCRTLWEAIWEALKDASETTLFYDRKYFETPPPRVDAHLPQWWTMWEQKATAADSTTSQEPT